MSLKDLFIQNYNMQMVATDLMDLIDEETLTNYMLDCFKKDFTYKELFELFSPYITDKEELKDFFEDIGFDFIDLDEENN